MTLALVEHLGTGAEIRGDDADVIVRGMPSGRAAVEPLDEYGELIA
jgi:hypothetical protein